MTKSHLVIIKKADGGISIHPLKKWLRENPENLPPGMHPDDNTSHQLRSGLKNNSWRLQFAPNEVFVVRPDEVGDTSYADEFIDEKVDEDDNSLEKEVENANEISFGLEKDLQLALRVNINQLEHDLIIIDGGKERTVKAGRIDITCKDGKGDMVVIELKAGRATSDVIAQVLSYMSVIADEEQKPVRGIIVAGDFHDRVVLAAKAVPNLDLVKYSFQFSFDKLD